MMERRKKTPAWLSLASQILEGHFNDIRRKAHNDTTRKHTMDCVRVLMRGAPLSDKQAVVFIDNIRKRVRGKSAFAWNMGDPIVLTEAQMRRANEQFPDLMAEINQTTDWAVTIHELLQDKIRQCVDAGNGLDEQQIIMAHLHSYLNQYVVPTIVNDVTTE